jgi:hypothetical protein
MSAVRIFGLALAAASVLASTGMSADEIHQRALDTSIPDSSISASQGQEGSFAKSSAEDLSSRIDQLEATRAGSDTTSKSPISLSVSGWVTQQVTITGK